MSDQYSGGRNGEEPSRGFTRGGFAPIPHRHSDLPPIRNEYDSHDSRAPPPLDRPDMRDPRDGGGRDVRDGGYRRDSFGGMDRDPRMDRDEFDRRGPPRRGPGPGPAWDDDYDRPKRRRSPSPHGGPNYRPRLYSPSPPPAGRAPYSIGGRLPPGGGPDGHGHGPGPGAGPGPGPDMRFNNSQGPPGLPDPATLDYQLNFRQFADWFRVSHPQTAKADEDELRRYKASLEEGNADPSLTKEKVGIGKRYERYRKEYTSRQLFALFLSHKPSPWFQERYSADPQLVNLRKRVNRQGRVPTVEKYIDALRAGQYDAVTYEQSDDKTKRSGTRRMSEHEEPEGLDKALGENHEAGPAGASSEDRSQVEIPPNTSQVFVKTVPPTIGRKELENLFATVEGFQFLALSEPSARKGFHRVAWAQYADGVDTEEVVRKLDSSRIDNFTLHMSVNSTATMGRLRVTPSQANDLQQLQNDGQRAKELAMKLEEELLGEAEDEVQEIAAVPAVEGAENAEASSSSEPAAHLKAPSLSERGSDLVEEHITRLLESQGLAGEKLSAELQLRKARLVTDHWISYLRNGLSTCYYCAAPTSFPEELQRKCVAHVRPPMSTSAGLEPVAEEPAAKASSGVEQAEDVQMFENAAPAESTSDGAVAQDEAAPEKEDREDEDQRDNEVANEERDGAENDGQRARQGSKRERAQQAFIRNHDERWAEGLEHRMRPLLGPVDVTEYGGRDLDAEAKRLTAPLIKQEEASKYRCKECSKLFRAPEFVIKHVTIKHGEVVKPKLDDVATLNNFVTDPQHLPVTAQTPATINDQLPMPPAALGAPGAMFNPAFLNGGGPGGGPNGSNGPGGPGNGLIQQQMMMMMQMQQAMILQMQGPGGPGGPGGPAPAGAGPPGRALQERISGYADLPRTNAPLPPPPPGGEDPRARRGRVSYQDLDAVGGGGDGGLPY